MQEYENENNTSGMAPPWQRLGNALVTPTSQDCGFSNVEISENTIHKNIPEMFIDLSLI